MEQKLWAVLIPGPDEVWAMVSKEKAETDAELHNATLTKHGLPEKWGMPFESVAAKVIEWPHSAEEHAEALMNGEPDVFGDYEVTPNALAHQAGAKVGEEAKSGCTGSGAATGSA